MVLASAWWLVRWPLPRHAACVLEIDGRLDARRAPGPNDQLGRRVLWIQDDMAQVSSCACSATGARAGDGVPFRRARGGGRGGTVRARSAARSVSRSRWRCGGAAGGSRSQGLRGPNHRPAETPQDARAVCPFTPRACLRSTGVSRHAAPSPTTSSRCGTRRIEHRCRLARSHEERLHGNAKVALLVEQLRASEADAVGLERGAGAHADPFGARVALHVDRELDGNESVGCGR